MKTNLIPTQNFETFRSFPDFARTMGQEKTPDTTHFIT